MADEKKIENEDDENMGKIKDNNDLPLKTSTKTKLIKIFVFIVISFLGLFIGLFFSPIDSDEIKNLLTSVSKDSIEEKNINEDSYADKSYINFDEMIVNVKGFTASGRDVSRFLKIKLTIVVNPKDEEKILTNEAFIRDGFQNYLRQLNEKEIQGSSGIEELRASLLKIVKTITDTDLSAQILIGELIVQ